VNESGVSKWIWVALAVVLVVGITGTYLVMRNNQQAVEGVEEVDAEELMALIQTEDKFGVYFFSPT